MNRARLVAGGLVLAGSTAVIALVSADRPRGFLRSGHYSWVFVVAVVVTGVSGGLKPIADSVREPRGERRQLYERRVDEILAAAFVKIVRLSGLEFTAIGMHAFLVDGWRHQTLRRAGHLRLVRRAVPSEIRWTKGKGVIGVCWATNKLTAIDIHQIRERALSASAEEWDAQPAEGRLGMTRAEYERSHTSGAIMAVPIVDRRAIFRGVVSLDGPPGSLSVLDQDGVWEVLEEVAHAVWVLGRRVEDL